VAKSPRLITAPPRPLTSETAIGNKLSIDATKTFPGEGFKRPWPPLIRMNEDVRRKIDTLFGQW
jgi:4-hydroxy-3-polyprenylbenzoate decarboxylase